jgi:DNA-directed RNA polymerase specialized sigma subunit
VATVSKPTYTAVCRRVGDWWAIDVPQIRGVHTQARRLDQVEAMARDAISLLRDVPADGFDVTVEPHLDDEAEQSVAASTDATRRARQATEEASRLQQETATTLLTKYRLTVRDAGALLHVSPQRVSQLAQKPAKTGADSAIGRSPRRRTEG